MSFIRRGVAREHPFLEETMMKSCTRCGSATGGVVDGLCASCDGRIADSIAVRPRTATIRGTPAPAHLPADPDDTVVVDPPPICEMLAAFVDGELDATAAKAFRDHLTGCSACEKDLLWQLQLDAALSTMRE